MRKLAQLLFFILTLHQVKIIASSDSSESTCPEECECHYAVDHEEIYCNVSNREYTYKYDYELTWLTLNCVTNSFLLFEDVKTIPALANHSLNSLGFRQCDYLYTDNHDWDAVIKKIGVASSNIVVFERINAESLPKSKDLLCGAKILIVKNLRTDWHPTTLPLGITELTVYGSNFYTDKLGNYLPELRKMIFGFGTINIASKELSKFNQLQFLSIWAVQFNNFTEDTLFGLTNLQHLDIHSSHMKELPALSLQNTRQLKTLSLVAQPLEMLEKGVFDNLTELESIEMKQFRSGNFVLPDGIFQNLLRLQTLHIEFCQLRTLGKNSFTGDRNIVNITLANNALEELPSEIFKDQTSLRLLDLSNNKLKELPNGIFNSLSTLETLYLDGNQLEKLTKSQMFGLKSLKLLSVKKCGLKTIYFNAYELIPKIEKLYMSENNLDLSTDTSLYSPFMNLGHLSHLDLSHNNITQVYEDWILSDKLKYLNLSYNHIAYLTNSELNYLSTNLEVDLRYNVISSVRLNNLLPVDSAPGVQILLGENPFDCDCNMFTFIQKIKEGINTINVNDAKCSSPSKMTGINLVNVDLTELECIVTSEVNCPDDCKCVFKPESSALDLNCYKLPSDNWPQLDGHVPEMDLTLLEQPTSLMINLPNEVTILNMSGIDLVEPPILQIIPKDLKIIDLTLNNLSSLPYNLIGSIGNTSIKLRLAGNPFLCDCSDSNAIVFDKSLVDDWSAVNCTDANGDQKAMVEDPCIISNVRSRMMMVLAVAAMSAAILSALLVGGVVRWNRNRILKKDGKEKELEARKADANAIYDAFISFASGDTAWVMENLIPKLESAGAKLCVHHRDWEAGGWVPTQIARSVQASRRTLVVVSDHAASSKWVCAEWRACRARSVREGRARVLPLLLSPSLPPHLPSDLAAHLGVVTYVSGLDPNLWQKLRSLVLSPVGPLLPNALDVSALDDARLLYT